MNPVAWLVALLCAALCPAFLLSAPAIGDIAPDITPTKCWNDSGGKRLSDYRGGHVLLVFWGTKCPACLAKIPALLKIQDTYGKRGFQVYSVTADKSDAVEAVIKEKNISYFVGVSQQALDGAYAVEYVPKMFVVDPKGKIIADKFPTNDAIETWLEDADIISEDLGAALKSAKDAYNKRAFGKAFLEAERIAGDGELFSEEDEENAQKIIDRINERLERNSAKMSAMKNDRDYIALFALLKVWQKEFAGLPFADEAAKLEKELKADKEVTKEVKVREQFEKIKARLESAKNDQQKSAIKKELEQFEEKHEGTRAAELADELALTIDDQK